MILERIIDPGDIKKLTYLEMEDLAGEIRDFLVDKISRTGGHLASNLGVVELTIALFCVFDLPKDKVIWDVGHQAYTHKILSGRKAGFEELRKYGGLSGFPKRRESPYDAFDTGHSSTSISAGLGIVQARDLLGEDYHVISVIGDGALTGGEAYEALNNCGGKDTNFIIVLNDNEMSISQNVGGMSSYLNEIRTAEGYITLKKNVEDYLRNLPLLGDSVADVIVRTKNTIKQMVVPGMLFENMGITYLGPVDGHDIRKLTRVLRDAKRIKRPVLVHVVTTKGKGYPPAERHPEKFHGVGKFDKVTGRAVGGGGKPGYTNVFSDKLCSLAARDRRIVAVTAAMPEGTGLSEFSRVFPDRFFDVGIAEQHAVTVAAGMASAGLRPVVAVYSSFLQRAYDQILMDVCLQELPVVFCIDRAGLVGADGETHQGLFDLTYLSSIPNMTVMAPKNKWELQDMMDFALALDGPVAIRYPRGIAYDGLRKARAKIEYGKSELIYEEKDIALIAVGSMVSTAEHIRDKLKGKGYSCSLVNGRFIKPVDTEMIDYLSKDHRYIITLEENVKRGGFGEVITDYVAKHHPELRMTNITLPDAYVEHGDVTKLRSVLGIDSDSILEKIEGRLERYGCEKEGECTGLSS
ncbi:MAG: 1-deoxy-D-xylulose-5-phosphate synthase [Lachnospiraceae bacterium]|nr:1-deoxy-D-xylulose-5-phosphate synthase [Lachnospiraceae bacterium]